MYAWADGSFMVGMAVIFKTCLCLQFFMKKHVYFNENFYSWIRKQSHLWYEKTKKLTLHQMTLLWKFYYWRVNMSLPFYVSTRAKFCVANMNWQIAIVCVQCTVAHSFEIIKAQSPFGHHFVPLREGGGGRNIVRTLYSRACVQCTYNTTVGKRKRGSTFCTWKWFHTREYPSSTSGLRMRITLLRIRIQLFS